MAESITRQNRINNVGAAERILCTAIGGTLALNAIRKPSAMRMAGALLGAELVYRGVSGHCQLYEALGLNTAATTKYGSQVEAGSPEVRRSITISRSPEELFAFWKSPQNLARIVSHFAEVTRLGEDLTHWRVRGPLKQTLEWDSRQGTITEGRKLCWESLPGSTLPNTGSVSFDPAPDGKGSTVALEMLFEPPLGPVGSRLLKTFHLVPRAIAGKTLRNLKSLVETGEMPTLENNPSARGQTDRF